MKSGNTLPNGKVFCTMKGEFFWKKQAVTVRRSAYAGMLLP